VGRCVCLSQAEGLKLCLQVHNRGGGLLRVVGDQGGVGGTRGQWWESPGLGESSSPLCECCQRCSLGCFGNRGEGDDGGIIHR
jgi:hypothetical protein